MFHLQRIEIAGFKSIHELKLDLRPFNILIGGNGAGKSNLLSFFGIMGAMAANRLDQAVTAQGGAAALLYGGVATTEAIKTRLRFSIDEKPGDMEFALSFAPGERLERGVIRSAFGGSIEERDALTHSWRNSSNQPDFHREVLQRWTVFHFQDTSPKTGVFLTGDLSDNLRLRPDARNLAAYLLMLRTHFRTNYERIRDVIRLAAPFFDDFVLEPQPGNDNTIILRWRDRHIDQEMGGWQLSDGTIRFICLVTLLHQPAELMPSLILLDEPELGLHPYALTLLASMLRGLRGSQVILATQSPALVDELVHSPEDMADVIVVDRDRTTGESIFRRLDPDALAGWMEDYAPGTLWEKGVLGGSPIA